MSQLGSSDNRHYAARFSKIRKIASTLSCAGYHPGPEFIRDFLKNSPKPGIPGEHYWTLHRWKALYRNTVTDLFGRLESPRRRVMSARHVQLLNLLLDEERITLGEINRRTKHLYSLKNPGKALIRDLNYLIGLGCLTFEKSEEKSDYVLQINLGWPMEITETEFFRAVKDMPKGRVHGFLSL